MMMEKKTVKEKKQMTKLKQMEQKTWRVSLSGLKKRMKTKEGEGILGNPGDPSKGNEG